MKTKAEKDGDELFKVLVASGILCMILIKLMV